MYFSCIANHVLRIDLLVSKAKIGYQVKKKRIRGSLRSQVSQHIFFQWFYFRLKHHVIFTWFHSVSIIFCRCIFAFTFMYLFPIYLLLFSYWMKSKYFSCTRILMTWNGFPFVDLIWQTVVSFKLDRAMQNLRFVMVNFVNSFPKKTFEKVF